MRLKTIVILTILILSIASITYSAIPHFINYQARLTDKDNKPLEGSYSITFRIYDSEISGTKLWEEIHLGVVINRGVFSVVLGAINNLDLVFDKPYFLEIKVGNDEPMSPRQPISAGAYAIRAEKAENGSFRGAIIMWSGSIANIPSGWALCDGTNGTPDLRDRFILGAGGALPQTGGTAEVTLTLQQLPNHRHLNSSHTHTGPTHTHTGLLHQHTQAEHTHGIGIRGVYLGNIQGFDRYETDWWDTSRRTYLRGGGGSSTSSAGDDDTSSSGTNITSSSAEYYTSSEGSGSAITNLPPYYALAFIMKL